MACSCFDSTEFSASITHLGQNLMAPPFFVYFSLYCEDRKTYKLIII
jgi:hypothetical protein